MLRRYFANNGPTGSCSKNGTRSLANSGAYSNGNCSAAGSMKKSNGLMTVISASKSTATRNVRVGFKNISRAT